MLANNYWSFIGIVVGLSAGLVLGYIAGLSNNQSRTRAILAMIIVAFGAGGILGWNGGARAQASQCRRDMQTAVDMERARPRSIPKIQVPNKGKSR